MLTDIISTPIFFLTKDRGYYGSLILGVIGLQVLQCLFTDALRCLDGSCNESIANSHLAYYLLDIHVVRCTIWYHLYNLKNVKNTHGGVLILVKLQAFKINTPPWVSFTFFKLYKWYQIAQQTTYVQKLINLSILLFWHFNTVVKQLTSLISPNAWWCSYEVIINECNS